MEGLITSLRKVDVDVAGKNKLYWVQVVQLVLLVLNALAGAKQITIANTTKKKAKKW